jgi:hypothetical protein
MIGWVPLYINSAIPPYQSHATQIGITPEHAGALGPARDPSCLRCWCRLMGMDVTSRPIGSLSIRRGPSSLSLARTGAADVSDGALAAP